MKLSMPRLSLFRFAAQFALLATIVPAVAHGQFSGPSLGNDTAINRPVTLTTDPAILYPADRELVISPGDTLAIHLLSAAEFAPVVRVSLEGNVSLPYIGTVPLKGLTTTQAERSIRERLVTGGFYKDPQVSVQITESPNQIITVAGEVHGIVPALGKRRLFDALAVAGGIPTTASHVITINRPGQDTPITVDLGTDPARSALANVPVFAGDTIIVPRNGVVYTLGAFHSQTMIPLVNNSPLTVLQAMALAGGTNFEGKKEEARIIRTQGTRRVEVKVNMTRIVAGKDPDPVLQPDDIIYLPSSSLKAAIRAGGIATLIGIAQISAYITLNNR